MVNTALNNGDWGWGPYIFLINPTVSEGNTGTVDANFTLTLAHASSVDLTFNYTTSDGTATAGSDYQAASGTLTIPAGQTTGTISVLVNGDRLPEPNETFVVNLSSPTNATIADGQGMGTIVDDEPRISIARREQEGGQLRAHGLRLHRHSVRRQDQPVTVAYATGQRHRHGRQRLPGRDRHPDLRPGRDQQDHHRARSTATGSPNRTRRSSST